MVHLHRLSPAERAPYFEAAAAQMGVSVSMIEKDYWVVFVLERMFALKDLKDFLTFKGGTSLSKVYGLIKRFSEDVDLSIERAFFGMGDDLFLDPVQSRKQRDTALSKLSDACSRYIRGTLLNQLSDDFSRALGGSDAWRIIVDETDASGQTLLFEYPCGFSDQAKYIHPSVKIEMGARAEHWPVSHHVIQSYTKEMLRDRIEEPEVQVKALNVERTFWEKATILHQYAHIPEDKKLPLRLSRHYYDFYSLIKAIDQAAKDTALLEKVAEHKSLYFPSTWAQYSSAKKGSLRLIPSENIIRELESDYRLMQDMFFEKPPAWNVLVEAIRNFEDTFNAVNQ